MPDDVKKITRPGSDSPETPEAAAPLPQANNNETSETPQRAPRAPRSVEDFQQRASANTVLPQNDPPGREPAPENDNNLPAARSSNPLATNRGPDDPFALPEQGARRSGNFSGPRFRLDHRTGEYMFPTQTGTLPRGSVLALLYTTRAWINLENGSVANQIGFIPGRPYPRREDLLPPKPPKGQMDPWKDTTYLHCVDPSVGEELTFYHSAFWGMMSIEEVIRRAAAKRREDPDVRPLVRFDATLHPAKGGQAEFWAPTLKIVAWVMPDGSEVAA